VNVAIRVQTIVTCQLPVLCPNLNAKALLLTNENRWLMTYAVKKGIASLTPLRLGDPPPGS